MKGIFGLVNEHRRVTISQKDNEDGCALLAVGEILNADVVATFGLLEFDVEYVRCIDLLEFKKLSPKVAVSNVRIEARDVGSSNAFGQFANLGQVTSPERTCKLVRM